MSNTNLDNSNENEENNHKYMQDIDEGLHSSKGAPTVWEKAMNSFGKDGDHKYGEQLIEQYVKMLEGITAEGMGSWSKKILAKRQATEDRIIHNLRQLYTAKGISKEQQDRFFEIYKKQSQENTARFWE